MTKNVKRLRKYYDLINDQLLSSIRIKTGAEKLFFPQTGILKCGYVRQYVFFFRGNAPRTTFET